MAARTADDHGADEELALPGGGTDLYAGGLPWERNGARTVDLSEAAAARGGTEVGGGGTGQRGTARDAAHDAHRRNQP
jgi:hypothetical protein